MIPIHFVISAPRSGSTWLTKALNHHPILFATEHRLFGDFCEIWPNNDGTTAPRITMDAYARAFTMHYMFDELGLTRPQFINQFQRGFINFISQFAIQRSDKKVLVDKVTPYAGTSRKVVQKIGRLLPKSKLIFLIRDGRDVLTSGTFDWIQRESLDSDRHRYFVKGETEGGLTRFFDDEIIQKWARLWKEVAVSMKGVANTLLVQYEAMKADHAKQLQRIFEFLEIDASEQISEECAQATTFKKMTGRDAGQQNQMAKARKGIAGDWKNYFTKRDGRLFHGIAGEVLKEFSYVDNDGWYEELPEKLNW